MIASRRKPRSLVASHPSPERERGVGECEQGRPYFTRISARLLLKASIDHLLCFTSIYFVKHTPYQWLTSDISHVNLLPIRGEYGYVTDDSVSHRLIWQGTIQFLSHSILPSLLNCRRLDDVWRGLKGRHSGLLLHRI
jgi:hypothetical protein